MKASIAARLMLLPLLLGATQAPAQDRHMERLDRGVVAVPAIGGGILVSWRLLASDAKDARFNLYRDGKKISSKPLDAGTNFVDSKGRKGSRYAVERIGGERSAEVPVWENGYVSIPLDVPPSGTTKGGEDYSYIPDEASAGDLDGDGRYELIVKWDPSNRKDNAHGGYTPNVYIDAYTLDGKKLWRIDLGPNIRAGSHYTQFIVQDFDGDGRAELAVKTADGTRDGTGRVIGDANANWVSSGGYAPQQDKTGMQILPDGRKVARMEGRIVKGPEYLSVFEGRTGRVLATAPYDPPRYPGGNPTPEQLAEAWGDAYANRADRFLAGAAYLDGKLPSMIFGRGYYARTVVAAWDYRGGKLTKRWTFDSADPGNHDYEGRGNHQLSIADVDADGRDEIIYGSMALDDNGKGLWSQPLYHGDAMHVGDLDPSRPGLEKYGVHEEVKRNGFIGAAMLDARTGEILWTKPGQEDVGRGVAADIDPRYPGAESWAANSPELWDVHGNVIGKKPKPQSFVIWWDGDRLRELLDGNRVMKYDWKTGQVKSLLAPPDVEKSNGTKSTPVLQADLLGDWREEIVWRTKDNRELRIYATPYPTRHRYVTLMNDPVYRAGVAWQNVAYNQPPHTSFYLGESKATDKPE